VTLMGFGLVQEEDLPIFCLLRTKLCTRTY